MTIGNTKITSSGILSSATLEEEKAALIPVPATPEPRRTTHGQQKDTISSQEVSFSFFPRHGRPLPPYWYCWPLVIGLLAMCIYFDRMVQAVIMYTVVFMIQPFVTAATIKRMISSMWHQPPGISRKSRYIGLSTLVVRLVLLYPLETCLWYLDELLFSGYKCMEIRQPVFIVGQPRSGTSKLQALLNANEEHTFSLKMYEIRFPYLCLHYLADTLLDIDRVLCGSACQIWLRKSGCLEVFGSTGQHQGMRKLNFSIPDEDDILFLFHSAYHPLMVGVCQTNDMIRMYHRFSELPASEQSRLMRFHRKVVSKVMYRRGAVVPTETHLHGTRSITRYKTYMAKWVFGWNGKLQAVQRHYPDARFIHIFRDPRESLPSWLKLNAALVYDFTKIAGIPRDPRVAQALKHEYFSWFEDQIRFYQLTPTDKQLLLVFDDFYKDIEQGVKEIHAFLSWSISASYRSYLQQQARLQCHHRKTKCDETMITRAEIEQKLNWFYPRMLTLARKRT